MKPGPRRFWMGAFILCALAGGGAVAAHLSGTRVAQIDRYEDARAQQRKAAAATRRTPAEIAAAPAKKVGCVKGADTFAVAISRVEPPPAMSGKEPRSRRTDALLHISDDAVRAEKEAELARPAPTLPKRMGLEGNDPVAPDRVACDGNGYAEFELHGDGAPAK